MKISVPAVIALLSIFGGLGTSALATEAPTGPYTLRIGSWVCTSLENHASALAAQRTGTSPYKVQKSMKDQCLYADDEFSEDVMPPDFVKIVERDGDFVMVSFVYEHYRKLNFLHRKITRMRYTGWTEHRNLESRF